MRVLVRWTRRGPERPATVRGELAELLRRAGVFAFRPYPTLLIAFATGVFGIAVPWKRGIEFYDAVLIFAYSLASVFLAGPAATDLVGSEWDTSRRVLSRIFACAIFSCALFAWLTGLGVATVLYAMRPAVVLPSPDVVAAAFAFNAAASLCLAAAGALIAVVLSPVAAKLIVRLAMIVALVGLLFGPRMLSPDGQAALAANLNTAGLTFWSYVLAAFFLLFAAIPIGALRGAHRG